MWQPIVDVLVALVSLLGVLEYFGIKPNQPLWGMRNWRLGIMLLLVGASLGMSGFGLYRSLRPKIVEKTVEKPVDRVVERIVQADCPKPKSEDPKSPQEKAGNSTQQTQSCVGGNCAQSSGQTGGITGQVFIPPLNPNDPFPTNSSQEVANWALLEADKIDDRIGVCLYDLQAISENKVTKIAMDASPSATRSSFMFDIQQEVPYIRKLHDSMLARLPSLQDHTMEMIWETELKPRDSCWHKPRNDGFPDVPSVSGYLRQMAHGLLAYQGPK